ncbi:MAG: efflux RND transporter periplasmic adaptor subunit, partial [Chloroflexota bacterium]
LEIVKVGPSTLQSPLTALGSEMARLERARLNLENTRLLALTDGVVTNLYYQVGEFANPGTPVIALTDVSILEAEVNLDETDVVKIALGMQVVVTVDAFPGMEVNGKVIEIAPTASVQSGVVLYPVTVRLNSTELPLRSGMTVNVSFPIEQRTDTLLVPFRAIETEGGQAYVTRVTASGSERVTVTLGLITDTQVEILDGLDEGDVVTVYANPVQDTELMKNPMFGGGQ